MDFVRQNGFRIGTTFIACSLGLGCASSLPAVLTSTPDSVAVEFAIDGSLSGATELARQECEKLGKIAEFNQVKKDATPNSRVAQFNCIDPNAAAVAAAPSEQETTPAVSAPAEEAAMPAVSAPAEEAATPAVSAPAEETATPEDAEPADTESGEE